MVKIDVIGMFAFFLGWQIVELAKALFGLNSLQVYYFWGIGIGLIASVLYAIIKYMIETSIEFKKKYRTRW